MVLTPRLKHKILNMCNSQRWTAGQNIDDRFNNNNHHHQEVAYKDHPCIQKCIKKSYDMTDIESCAHFDMSAAHICKVNRTLNPCMQL
jgi:hypothetical protein